MEHVKQVAVYARSAAENQESIDEQLQIVREYAAEKGYEIVAEFVDNGASGNDLDREGLQSLIDRVRSEQIRVQALIVSDRSRLARGGEAVMRLPILLNSCGLEFLSVSEPAVESPAAKLLLGIIEAFETFGPDSRERDM